MAVNYDDERFQQVTREQNAALQNLTNTYNNMISQSDKYYQDQIKAAENYANTQQQLQQQNTDFTIQKIEQQKERAEKDYTKEQKGAYVDYQKESNQYGVNAEQLASAGLRGGGYSESSQVSMYNQYQNRVSVARESYNRAVQDYDNSITEARLTNNAKLAEIAYNALQTKLQLSLSGFEYKNKLLVDQINQTQALKDTYYNRWQDVLKQINYENEQAENQRRYEEQMAMERAAQAQAAARSSGGGYSLSSGGGSSKSSGGGYTLGSGATGGSAAPKKVNGVTYTATNDYIQDASGQYLQLYKDSSGNKYYWNGSKYVKWSSGTTKNTKTTTSNNTKTQNNSSLGSKILSGVLGTAISAISPVKVPIITTAVKKKK